MTPKTVYVLPDRDGNPGRVVVSDKNGKEIPELRGLFKDMKEKILDVADENTEFNGWPNVTCVTRFRKSYFDSRKTDS